MHLQAASVQFQGVLADHQHQEDQGDQEGPERKNKRQTCSYSLKETESCAFTSLTLTSRADTHPLARISRGAWCTRWAWGSRETLFQTRPLSLHTLYINNKIQRNSHICSGRVLSVLLQSGHTWGKGMHEAIWDSMLGCKSSERHFLFVHSTMLEWLYSKPLSAGGLRAAKCFQQYEYNLFFEHPSLSLPGNILICNRNLAARDFHSKEPQSYSFTGCGSKPRQEWGCMDIKTVPPCKRGQRKEFEKNNSLRIEFNEKQINLLLALQAQGDPPPTFPENTHIHTRKDR